MTDQRATHPCDGCGTYTADRVCPSCWGTTDDPMWCRLCNGVCQEGPGCSPMREDRMATEAQNTPVSAHGLPSAGLEGQDATQETQDATEAAQGRVERYAEKAVDVLDLNPQRAHDRMVSLEVGSAFRDLADQEQAGLRAEVERLREDKRWFERARDQWILTTEEQVTALAREEDRADAAEARVAELEAIVAKVREVHQPYQLFEPCPKTWGCEHDDCCEDPADGEYYHSDKPVSRACVECRDEDGQPVDWPCETAAILRRAEGHHRPVTTHPCPFCGRDIPLPVTFRTHPAHDTKGCLVVSVSMLRQDHRCSPKEGDECDD